jgi:hypothetical protein
MIIKMIVGASLRRTDEYISRPGSRFVCGNMAGATPRERRAEFAMLRSARPRLKKVCAHMILSASPSDRDIAADEWTRCVEIALREHGALNAGYVAFRHPPDHDRKHDHVHVVFCRVLPDSTVVSDSHSYRKNERAARRIERVLGLHSPPPAAPTKRIGDRVAIDRARRRADRRGTARAARDPITLCRKVALEVKSSRSRDELFERLANVGVEARERLGGWVLREEGSREWLKGSTLNRLLSWAHVQKFLERNAIAAADRLPSVELRVSPHPVESRIDAAHMPEQSRSAEVPTADELQRSFDASLARGGNGRESSRRVVNDQDIGDVLESADPFSVREHRRERHR